MKLDNVKPLDIDQWLGKAKNKVALVGVELEGAWKTIPTGITEIIRDGSVYRDGAPPGCPHVGEIPTRTVTPAGIGAVIRHHYPAMCNASCGLHVHMSFDSLWHYKLLMVPEYPATMVEYLKRWAKEKGIKDTHHIWERLNGRSQYCKHEFYPDLQAQNKRKTHDMGVAGQRYTGIHYCGRLNTIECRILPMFKKVSLAQSAVKEVISITNACIYLQGKKFPRAKDQVKINLPDNYVYEETIVNVV